LSYCPKIVKKRSAKPARTNLAFSRID